MKTRYKKAKSIRHLIGGKAGTPCTGLARCYDGLYAIQWGGNLPLEDLEPGKDYVMTGVVWSEAGPRDNYELILGKASSPLNR